METGSIKNKKYSEVTLAVIISVMMLSPVLSFADIVSLPIPQGFSISSPFSEDLGKPLGSPKIINTHSNTTKTYSKEFLALGSNAPGNICDKIIWKVDKDKILDVYTEQERVGFFVKAAGVEKIKTRSNKQKCCMAFRHRFIIGFNIKSIVIGCEDTFEHEITIFRDGRSYLKRNTDK